MNWQKERFSQKQLTSESFENGNKLTFCSVFSKGKKAFEGKFVRTCSLIVFGKTSLSASSFSSSIVICVKIFNQWLEFSSSVRLRFSFYNSFVLIKTKLGSNLERQSQHPSPQGLHIYFKVYLVETKSTVSIHSLMWRWSLLKTGHYCVWLELASIFVSLVFEKTLKMAKKLVKMIGCRYVCCHIWGITHFLLGKTSRISASRFSSS